MPRRYASKKRPIKKGAKSFKRRRLQANIAEIGAGVAIKAAGSYIKNSQRKGHPMLRGAHTLYKGGNFYVRRQNMGKHGVSVDSGTGAAPGFKVGRTKRLGAVMQKRKTQILSTLADTRYPVLKNHLLGVVSQLDWNATAQAVVYYDCGYNTPEIEQMLTQAQSASYIDTQALVEPASTDTLTNQKMDFYAKTTKFNFKNTCTHTVYIEIRAYRSKGYHSFSIQDSWNQALANDQMVQDSTTYNTSDETIASIGKRPDMKYAELNVRWSQHLAGSYKCTLEPGQETSYTYVQPGSRFDKQRFNVQQGSFAVPVDVDYCPSSTQILVFCRAEMVADRQDNDVSFGSGHIAVNKEEWKSWCCVPYTKPRQESYQNNWGTIVEADELDLNQNRLLNETYVEQV